QANSRNYHHFFPKAYLFSPPESGRRRVLGLRADRKHSWRDCLHPPHVSQHGWSRGTDATREGAPARPPGPGDALAEVPRRCHYASLTRSGKLTKRYTSLSANAQGRETNCNTPSSPSTSLRNHCPST